MPQYLLTVSQTAAARMERLSACPLEIIPSNKALADRNIPVAGLDAVTDDETRMISARLGTSGPFYHAGGPDGSSPPAEGEWRRAGQLVGDANTVRAAIRAIGANNLGNGVLLGDLQRIEQQLRDMARRA
jgi:hypothetical protein